MCDDKGTIEIRNLLKITKIYRGLPKCMANIAVLLKYWFGRLSAYYYAWVYWHLLCKPYYHTIFLTLQSIENNYTKMISWMQYPISHLFYWHLFYVPFIMSKICQLMYFAVQLWCAMYHYYKQEMSGNCTLSETGYLDTCTTCIVAEMYHKLNKQSIVNIQEILN